MLHNRDGSRVISGTVPLGRPEFVQKDTQLSVEIGIPKFHPSTFSLLGPFGFYGWNHLKTLHKTDVAANTIQHIGQVPDIVKDVSGRFGVENGDVLDWLFLGLDHLQVFRSCFHCQVDSFNEGGRRYQMQTMLCRVGVGLAHCLPDCPGASTDVFEHPMFRDKAHVVPTCVNFISGVELVSHKCLCPIRGKQVGFSDF